MFENRQDKVEQLLSENIEFRRLYQKHQQLHQRVHDAEFGVQPMEDMQLAKLKKEKLWAKDRLARILDQHSLSAS
ncbi:MAG: YdcH family protein [Xanthomonadales bacterium]|nr:YdcH family protein [Xanthomonadales bacterium]